MNRDLKIKKQSAADLVCDKIKELILQGTWSAGDRVPTEMELSELFGVNRLTVRVAMQRLHTLGLLDIRVGDGTYVKEFDMNRQIQALSEFYVNEDTVQNVLEYRLLLELGCAKFSVARRTEEELEHFSGLCSRFRSEMDQYYAEPDPDTAKAIILGTIETCDLMNESFIKMAHNDLITYSYALAKAPLRKHIQMNAVRRIESQEKDHYIWVDCMEGIRDALRDRDLEKCTDCLHRLILEDPGN